MTDPRITRLQSMNDMLDKLMKDKVPNLSAIRNIKIEISKLRKKLGYK